MKPRFVIIGTGRIAHRHAVQIERIGILAGVCDPSPLALRDFTSKFPVPAFDSPESLLAHCSADIAVICSPNGFHAQHIKLAMAAGLHVLCEKPVLIDIEEADQVRHAIQEAGKLFFSVLSARFHPVIRELKHSLASGIYGPVLSFSLNAIWSRPLEYYEKSSWKGTTNLDGGILYTQFSHYLDALCWCLGKIHPLAVKTANYLHLSAIEKEDTGVALLQGQTGALGNFHWSVNSFHQNLEICWVILTEKATIKISGEYMNVLEYEYSINSNSGWQKPISSLEQQVDHSHHDLVYNELEKAFAGQPHQLPDLEEALESIRLISDIYRISAS
jgi:UDP-N-acetyl-2-amino-2-deoxyglucuronate dehydrogenase